MLKICFTGLVGLVIHIFTCPANIFTGPATKIKIVAVIIVIYVILYLLKTVY